MKKAIKKALIKAGFNPQNIRVRPRNFDESDLIYQLICNSGPNTMIDVGFAWGSTAIPYLMRGWRVLGFEPDKSKSKESQIELLEQCFPDTLVISRTAVSNKDGETVRLYTSTESEGITSLHDFRSHQFSHEVKTITLDSAIREHQIGEIAFLKVDAEGHDLFVLQSLSFETISPAVVMAEFDHNKTSMLGHTCEDLSSFLAERQYVVYVFEWFPIEKYGAQHKIRAVHKAPAKLDESQAWGNVVAVNPQLAPKFESVIRNSILMKIANIHF